MGINGNGNGRPPPQPPGGSRDVRRRRRDSGSDSDVEAQNGGRARHNQAVNRARRAVRGNVAMLQWAVRGVRNVLNSPLTTVSLVVGAIAASYTLSWLFGASGAINNNLSGGNLPNLGGAPPPPPLHPNQHNGPMLQGNPPPPPIPTLEEILANAGYPPEEQADRQASEPPNPLPPCPEQIIFITPELGASGGLPPPSQTREKLNNGEAANLCSGPPPRVTVRPIRAGQPRFQCRDTATGMPSTPCTSPDPAQTCPSGEQVEQCAGANAGSWGEATGWTCVNANGLGKDVSIVLENTHGIRETSAPATSSESAEFDNPIGHFCRENTEIYSEEPPFEGASGYARDRVQFDATPEDILRQRRRDAYRAQRAAEERARQTAGQEAQGANAEEAGGPDQDNAQSSSNHPQEGPKSNNPDGDKTEQ
ncbi:MAG: hypothetical protein ACRC9R_00580 [Enterovibrio sp.]